MQVECWEYIAENLVMVANVQFKKHFLLLEELSFGEMEGTK